jgi:hypothetical protein
MGTLGEMDARGNSKIKVSAENRNRFARLSEELKSL